MPLFKKVSVDTGSMLETHRRSLRRCRLIFLKDLDVSQVMDHMAPDDGFRQEQRDAILACATREQRVATFLDHLESRGERAFGLFQEALKARYKHLYTYIEETIQTIDEWDNSLHSEKASISGVALRRMLGKRKMELATQSNEESENVADKISGDLQSSVSSNYINCYSITAKGHLQKDKWILHIDDCKPYSLQRNEKSYMAAVRSNLICRRIDWDAMKLRPGFKRPPSDQIPAYLFEKETSYVFPSMSRQTSHDVGDSSLMTAHRRREKTEPGNKSDMHDCIPTNSFRMRSSMPPPPVPPKPDNLPMWGLVGCPPLPKPRKASDGVNVAPPPRTTSTILLPNGQIKPPMSKSKPCTRIQQSQSADSALRNLKQSFLVPSLSQKIGGTMSILKASSFTDGNFAEVDSEDEDCVSLNYNVSVASTLEPDDESQYPEDEEDDCDTVNEGDSSLIGIINGSDPNHLDINKNRRKSATEGQVEEYSTEEQVQTEQQEQSVQEQLPEESQVPQIQTQEEPINSEQMQLWEEEPTDNRPQVEQSCEALSFLVAGNKGSADEESKEEVKYDLPPCEDADDDGSQTIENDSDTPNATDPQQQQHVRLPKPSVDQPTFADDEFSSDNSYYEEIEQFFVDCPSPSVQSCSTYLDPYTSSLRKRASNRSSHHFVVDEFRKSGRKLLCRNSLLLVETDSYGLDLKSLSDYMNIVSNGESPQEPDSSDVFKGTTLGFDKEGCAFYVPSQFLKRYGEPEGEPWFYPTSMTSRQASLFLSSMRQEGCFVVYCPDDGVSNVAYNLSVCLTNGDVVHYHILENVHGDFGIEGHDHTFMTVSELVEYFRRNKSSLATRLRRPLSCAKQPITPGYHYDIRYELNRNDLSLTGNIIGQGNFGVVCSGLYRNVSVAVKVLQKSDNLTPADEDDFIEEAIAMMELRHDHIVRFVGISCKLRPYFLVTEYMQKGNLKDCLRSGVVQSDNIDMLFDVCIQVVSAMQYLEGLHFMLHRDLAARNFLVDDHLRIKLADFGRARLVSDDYYQAPGTEKICIKWASPEVLIYSHYSTKSDVWALGVVFWEVFSSGARPFSLFSGEQTAMYVTEGGRLDKPPGCPADIYDVMKSCWLEDPDDRPSFHDLAETLKSISCVYYSKLSNQKLLRNRPAADAVKHSSTLPSKPKTPPGKSVVSPTSAGTNSRMFNVRDKSTKCDVPNEKRERSKSDTRYILNHEGPFTNYLSDLSIATVSSEITDLDQDVSRGDRIRKSLRRLINKKSKTKINELGGKAVHILQDFPAVQ